MYLSIIPFQIVTPLKTISFMSDYDDSNGEKMLKLKSIEDGKEAMKMEVIIDPRTRHVEMEVFYDRGEF